MSFKPIHLHLIIRAEVKDPPVTELAGEIFLEQVINEAGMTCISGPHCKYVDSPGNEGLTGVAILAESHCAIHVWDAEHPALLQLDLYSCKVYNPRKIMDLLWQFEPTRVEYKLLDRENGLNLVEIPNDPEYDGVA